MEIQLDEHAYQKLIDKNIEALNKYMPEHSLEKKHTIEVLKWSVDEIYHRAKTKPSNDVSALPIPDVSNQRELLVNFAEYLNNVSNRKIIFEGDISYFLNQ